MGNSNSQNANNSPCAISGRKGKGSQNGHTSSSSSTSTSTSSSSSSTFSSAKTTAVLGTLSHSVASSLTTDTSTSVTTSTEQSSNGGGGNSSLGTSHNSQHSLAATADEETDHHHRRREVEGGQPFYENHHFYHHHRHQQQLQLQQLQQQQQQQQQHRLPNVPSRTNRLYKNCNGSTDSLNCADVGVALQQQHQHQQRHHESHYSFSDAGLHTASSFELVQPIDFRGAAAGTEIEPLSLLPQYRPHSVLGLNEQHLHRSMSSSCASSVTTSTVTSTDSCCSSGEQSSVEEEEVEEVVVVENSSDHYSRIERNHYHQRTPAAASSAFGGHNREHQSKQKHKGKRKSHSKQGIRVPVMPLPRSKSFHQILRPTANGHILASNGTIRGAGKGKLVAKSSRDLVLLGDDQQQQQQQPQQQESLQPLANRVKQLFGPKTTTSSSNNNNKSSSKDHSSGEKARLSKSESNLHYPQFVKRAPSVDLIAEQHSSQYHPHHYDEQNYHYHPHHHHYHQQHQLYQQQQQQQEQKQRRSSESFRKPEKPQSKSASSYVPNSANVFTVSLPMQTSATRTSKEGSIRGKHSSAVPTSGGNVSGAVAAKIQRARQQHRANQICQQNASVNSTPSTAVDKLNTRDLSPLSKMALNAYFFSSSTQEVSNDIVLSKSPNSKNSGGHTEKNCKIKRSVSNFDASVYFRQHDAPATTLSGTTVDSPWKLQKPNYDASSKNGVPDWYSQYLSFEFLNERIKSRLQEEINYQRRSIATDNSSICDYSRQDSAYQTSRSEDSKQHQIGSRCFAPDRSHTKLSCSEANLNTPNTPKTKAKGSNGLGKRKSFKKLIEQYFVHNNSSCDSSTSSLDSSSAYAIEPSTFAHFDQNFILKRNTPNAGLSDQKFQQQSNIKEYFDNEQSIYEKTWRKKRPSQSTHSNSSQSQTNGRSNFSTIDRQLQMFENILNQAESQLADHDELIMHLEDNKALHKSNLSLTDQTNCGEFAQTNVNSSSNNSSQLKYLKLIGKSDNSLSAGNIKMQSKTRKNGQHQHSDYHNQNSGLYWTPLNDLSSESEFEDDFEYDDELLNKAIHRPDPVVTELLIDNLVDIEVEDFNCHQFRAPEPPVPMPRQHLTVIPAKTAESQHQSSSCKSENNVYKLTMSPEKQSPITVRKNGIPQLPSGPCFTLSNQLKTLLHNSNRLKSQNYLFY